MQAFFYSLVQIIVAQHLQIIYGCVCVCLLETEHAHKKQTNKKERSKNDALNWGIITLLQLVLVLAR